jgi:hypothetical protein
MAHFLQVPDGQTWIGPIKRKGKKITIVVLTYPPIGNITQTE